MKILLVSYLAVIATRWCLEWLNVSHLQRHGAVIPQGMEPWVDPAALARSRDYSLAKARLGLVRSAVGSAATLWFLFGGWLPGYDRWLQSLAGTGTAAGVLFFLGLHYAQTLLGMPFQLLHTFRVEQRFGFNRTTPRLWLSDLAKSELLTTLLLALLSAAAVALVDTSPQWWWLWLWTLFVAVTVFLMYLSPYVLEPLFFKMEPVKDADLVERISELLARAGVSLGAVLQVDASRRSGHANAYFTGIGRVKRIVLFDTLLQSMSHAEILAVLAHELGHWKHRHVLRRLAVSALVALLGTYLASLLLDWRGLPLLVGTDQLSLAPRLLLLMLVGSLALFPLTPLGSWVSRRDEQQADRYAAHLTGSPADLARALGVLGRGNLANLHPHPAYAWFHFSHPPLAQRIGDLLAAQATLPPQVAAALDEPDDSIGRPT